MISVVISTYNGEKYIVQQLLSIVQQTIIPNEVVIVDDCSTDNTFSIIENFIEKHNGINWKLFRNDINLGWKKNFINAISKAEGDIIFTCDQDDVWNKQKIEIMSYVMHKYAEINLLVSDFNTNDPKIKNALYCKEHKKIQVKKIQVSDKFMYILYPGCTYCFRKKFFDRIKKFWFEDYPHDAFLWRYAISTESLYYLPIKMIYWRRHTGAATTYKIKTLQEKIEMVTYYEKALDQLLKLELSPHIIKKCKKFKDYLWCRNMFLQSHNIFYWIRGLCYLSCYYNVKAWIGDLVEMIWENINIKC